MNHTPNLVLRLGWSPSPSRNLLSKSIGDQIASLYITWEEELTMIPRELTSEKPNGTDNSWGNSAADGDEARDAKSGAFLRWKGKKKVL